MRSFVSTNYLSIWRALALLLTLSIWIKHLSGPVVAIVIDTAAFWELNTFISTKNVAVITGTALRTLLPAALRRSQVLACGRTGSCTNFVVAVHWAFQCCTRSTLCNILVKKFMLWEFRLQMKKGQRYTQLNPKGESKSLRTERKFLFWRVGGLNFFNFRFFHFEDWPDWMCCKINI